METLHGNHIIVLNKHGAKVTELLLIGFPLWASNSSQWEAFIIRAKGTGLLVWYSGQPE